MASPNHNVFVYGTLKRGQQNYALMTDSSMGEAAVFCGSGRTVEEFPLLVHPTYNNPYFLDYPGKGKRIFGEVFNVTSKVLGILDMLEDYPRSYIRKLIYVELEPPGERSGTVITKCMVYCLKEWDEKWLELPCAEEFDGLGRLGYIYGGPICKSLQDAIDNAEEENKKNVLANPISVENHCIVL